MHRDVSLNYSLLMNYLPVHSLLFVKSIPRIRFEDSKPSFLKALVTCVKKKKNSCLA